MEGAQYPRAHRKAIMPTKTHNISPAPAVLRPTAPISTPPPSKILIPNSQLLIPDSAPFASRCAGADSCLLTSVFKERTQFHPHKTHLTVFHTTTYIAPTLARQKQSNPIPPPPRPHATLLSISSVEQYKSPSKTTPNKEILKNRCESVSEILKERTQFLTPKSPLTLCFTTTYITPLATSPERTNPIPPACRLTLRYVLCTFFIFTFYFSNEPIPNPNQTPFEPARAPLHSAHLAHLRKSHPIFPFKTTPKARKNCKKSPKTPSKLQKTAQNALKMHP